MGGRWTRWSNTRFKNIYIYGLSPFAQKVSPGGIRRDAIKQGNRLLQATKSVGPWIVGVWGAIKWAESLNANSKRKQPGHDYTIRDD